jgi:hypothetical protein
MLPRILGLHLVFPGDAAVVVTADPDDILALATAVPGTRIVTRTPSTLG